MIVNSMISLLTLFFIRSVTTFKDECGIIGSSENFPWNVGIYIGDDKQVELICLGSVIQANAILTAAHCFYDNVSGNLRNETFYITTDDLPKKIFLTSTVQNLQKIQKSNIHVHKYFKGISNLFENDLAIVKEKFHFSKKVQPICVDWSIDLNDDIPSVQQPIWKQNKITKIVQNFIDLKDCFIASPELTPFLTEDKFCTKNKDPGISLSHESEGGGLVTQTNNKWYIQGVISMHDVKKSEISTYTKVKQYINWISNICASQ